MAALVLVLIILIKKIPKVKTLDVATILEEKEAIVRDRIFMDRMQRRVDQSKNYFANFFQFVFGGIKKFFSDLNHKVAALEKKYQHEASQKINVKSSELAEKINSLFIEAQDFLKQEQYSEAEKKYIEIISLDATNKKAYQGLTNIYLQQKEFSQALETTKYVLKLDQKNSKEVIKLDSQGRKYKSYSNSEDLTEDYIKLAEVWRENLELQKAKDNLERALSYTPNDPKTLDLLIDVCLNLKEKSQALKFFNKLQKINPGNQKLIEYRKKLDEI